MHEQDYNEALKHTHSGGTLDLYVNMFTLSLDLLVWCRISVLNHMDEIGQLQMFH